jgi:murein DD-endopeptidase MepM/ murein hydrolase activator NlpD
MAIDLTQALGGTGLTPQPLNGTGLGPQPLNGTGLGPQSTDSSQPDRQEVRRLAEQFEAMLLTQMLREMRRSMLDEDENEQNGLGAGPLTDIGNQEFGNALSRSGGLGLTDALLGAFERAAAGRTGQAGPAGPAGQVGQAGQAGGADLLPSGTLPAAFPTILPTTGAAPISSRFGWRQDPITGESTFHKGIDIAVAYGHEVTAAADGTVSFAGTQGGYGQTVIVDHADGRQTRYAHLSEQLVKAGDRVAEGQVLARSGNSGRSTGPHLHFEMLVAGQPVDPATELE